MIIGKCTACNRKTMRVGVAIAIWDQQPLASEDLIRVFELHNQVKLPRGTLITDIIAEKESIHFMNYFFTVYSCFCTKEKIQDEEVLSEKIKKILNRK